MTARAENKTVKQATPTPWFSVAEAAEILGLSKRAIQLRAKKGLFSHQRVRSPETGRMRLMVYSEQLARKATTIPALPKIKDFIPRFSTRQSALGPDEFTAITTKLKAVDHNLSVERDRLRIIEQERDRLARELARAMVALESEKNQAVRQEKSLHRFIDRQQDHSRTREDKLMLHVSRLARELGKAEHQVLLMRRQNTWWYRMTRFLRSKEKPLG